MNASTVAPSTRMFLDTPDPQQAIMQLIERLGENRASLFTLFPAGGYDVDGLARVMRKELDGPVIACSTAGTLLGQHGYLSSGVVAGVFTSDALRVDVHPIPNLSDFGPREAKKLGWRIREQVEAHSANWSSFGVLVIDGLSRTEERVVALLHGSTNLPLAGGSAGDGVRFARTTVFDGESFASNCAMLFVISTSLPYELFRFEHFEPASRRMVVTRADTNERRIYEIDGLNAADVYGELIHADPTELSIDRVASSPLLMRSGNEYFARSLQHIHEDGSLAMYCAIEEGMVVCVGRRTNLLAALANQLENVDRKLGGMSFALAFDCIQRRQEIESKDEQAAFVDVIGKYPLVGFSTYGEQFCGLHINQTLTGFALGS